MAFVPNAPIQTIPPGLLSLLQLKAMGRNPTQLLDQVQPSIELRDWFFQARNFDESVLFPSIPFSNTTVAARGFNSFGATAVVPNGQWWYVTHFFGYGNLLATEGIRLQMALLRPPTGIAMPLGTDYADNVTSARARAFASSAVVPFWAHPGDQFGFMVSDVATAATVTVFGGIRATNMTI